MYNVLILILTCVLTCNFHCSYQDIKLKEDGGIPVSPFLDACRALIPIFDKLGPTAFAPVKMDISGNIKVLVSNQKDH